MAFYNFRFLSVRDRILRTGRALPDIETVKQVGQFSQRQDTPHGLSRYEILKEMTIASLPAPT